MSDLHGSHLGVPSSENIDSMRQIEGAARKGNHLQQGKEEGVREQIKTQETHSKSSLKRADSKTNTKLPSSSSQTSAYATQPPELMAPSPTLLSQQSPKQAFSFIVSVLGTMAMQDAKGSIVSNQAQQMQGKVQEETGRLNINQLAHANDELQKAINDLNQESKLNDQKAALEAEMHALNEQIDKARAHGCPSALSFLCDAWNDMLSGLEDTLSRVASVVGTVMDKINEVQKDITKATGIANQVVDSVLNSIPVIGHDLAKANDFMNKHSGGIKMQVYEVHFLMKHVLPKKVRQGLNKGFHIAVDNIALALDKVAPGLGVGATFKDAMYSAAKDPNSFVTGKGEMQVAQNEVARLLVKMGCSAEDAQLLAALIVQVAIVAAICCGCSGAAEAGADAAAGSAEGGAAAEGTAASASAAGSAGQAEELEEAEEMAQEAMQTSTVTESDASLEGADGSDGAQVDGPEGEEEVEGREELETEEDEDVEESDGETGDVEEDDETEETGKAKGKKVAEGAEEVGETEEAADAEEAKGPEEADAEKVEEELSDEVNSGAQETDAELQKSDDAQTERLMKNQTQEAAEDAQASETPKGPGESAPKPAAGGTPAAQAQQALTEETEAANAGEATSTAQENQEASQAGQSQGSEAEKAETSKSAKSAQDAKAARMNNPLYKWGMRVQAVASIYEGISDMIMGGAKIMQAAYLRDAASAQKEATKSETSANVEQMEIELLGQFQDQNSTHSKEFLDQMQQRFKLAADVFQTESDAGSEFVRGSRA